MSIAFERVISENISGFKNASHLIHLIIFLLIHLNIIVVVMMIKWIN